MKTLIISCTTGEGHNSCARAIKEVFDSNNESCEITNGLAFISKGLSKFVSTSHIILYRYFPKLFNYGYNLSEKHPSVFAPGSLIYNIFSKGTEKLHNYIKSNGFDTVICTHPFAAVILTEMQNRYRLPIRTSFVATDYTCSPSVKDSNLDIYFIPDNKLTDDFICDHIGKDKIFSVGIPIRQRFYSPNDKNSAKENCGISSEKKHVVLMCGSMGCGPLAKLAISFAKQMPECEFSIICGTNTKLKRSLDKKSSNIKNLHILGFVKDMPTMLEATDLYLTKPGGISTSEAVAKEVPMLFVNTVAACETYNLNHFLAYKVADSGKNVKELTEKCIRIINDDDILKGFRKNLHKINKVNAAQTIRQILIENNNSKN